MKGRHYNKLVLALLHPTVLALPVAVLVIIVLPDAFNKYTLKPISERILEPRTNIEYHDLDHDGISEWFYAGDNGKHGSAIVIYNKSGPLYQWDFDGLYLPERQKCITGDTDNNSVDEIYAFTLKGDSLLLNGVDPRRKKEFIVSDRFLCRIPPIAAETGEGFTIISLSELNGDNHKEIIFALSAGFGIIPRRIFAYDVANDSVFSSPELGGHIGGFDIEDVDRDGKVEIAVSNYGPGNITDESLPMQDTSAYLIVLDDNLQFLFTPIAMPGRFNGMGNQFVKTDGKWMVLSYWGYYSQLKEYPSLRLYDLRGNLIRKHLFTFYDKGKGYTVRSLPDQEHGFSLLLSPFEGEPLIYDSNFNQKNHKLPATGYSEVVFSDLDQDGSMEIIYRSPQPDEWVILKGNLKDPVFFKTELTSESTPKIYHILNKNHKPQFCFQVNNHQYIMEYGYNQMFLFQYPVYVGIYLFILGFILVIRRIQRVQIQRKYATEKKLAELQLLSLRNQMDPHFTFNVLNTIGSVILQKKSDESYDLLMKFSRMIRTTINSANKICRPLEEELNFVKNYLELQQFRHTGYFNYRIEVAQGVNSLQPVPKMILQTYVENALKHGLVPKKGGGELLITVLKREECLVLSVQDNGVGRQQARLNGTVSTGVGLSILNQYYQVLNRENNRPITEEFTDLFDERGNVAGTRVVVCIPEGFVFPGAPEGK
ncbi:MAG: sensor histidine kinase [Lentimicrobium sp.]